MGLKKHMEESPATGFSYPFPVGSSFFLMDKKPTEQGHVSQALNCLQKQNTPTIHSYECSVL